MQGSVQFDFVDISPVEKRLNVEVAREQVNHKLDEAYRKLSREVNLRGFRKGKAPRALLERLYGPRVNAEVANQLVNESMVTVSQQRTMRMVSQPTVELTGELKRDQPLRYSARIELVPTIEAKDYDGIEVTRRPAEVTDEQLADALERRRRDHAEMLPIEGRQTAGPNDTLAITINGEVGPARYENTEVNIDLSEPDRVLPGLVQALVGIPLDAKDHEIRVTLPERPGVPPELVGKEGTLKIEVRAAHEKHLPELDDDFAKDTGEADTLDELRDKTRKSLLEEDGKEAEEEVGKAILDEVLKRNPVPLPPSLVERQVKQMVDTFVQQAQRGGSASSIDMAEVREAAHGEAVRQLQVEFVLTAIAEQEKVEVTEAEVEKHLAERARLQDRSVARLKAELQKGEQMPMLRMQLRLEKTLELLQSRAKIDGPKSE